MLRVKFGLLEACHLSIPQLYWSLLTSLVQSSWVVLSCSPSNFVYLLRRTLPLGRRMRLIEEAVNLGVALNDPWVKRCLVCPAHPGRLWPSRFRIRKKLMYFGHELFTNRRTVFPLDSVRPRDCLRPGHQEFKTPVLSVKRRKYGRADR